MLRTVKRSTIEPMADPSLYSMVKSHLFRNIFDRFYDKPKDNIFYDKGLDKIIYVTPTPSPTPTPEHTPLPVHPTPSPVHPPVHPPPEEEEPVECPKFCVPEDVMPLDEGMDGSVGRHLKGYSHRSLLFGHFHLCPKGCVFDYVNYPQKTMKKQRRSRF